MRPEQLCRQPPLTFVLHWTAARALQPSLALLGGRAPGINHCRPCLSRAEPAAPRSASIHRPCTQGGMGIFTDAISFNPHTSLANIDTSPIFQMNKLKPMELHHLRKCIQLVSNVSYTYFLLQGPTMCEAVSDDKIVSWSLCSSGRER